MVRGVASAVDGRARSNIGADQMEFHWVAGELRGVEDVEFFRQRVIAEFRTEKVARQEQRPPRRIAPITAETEVVTQNLFMNWGVICLKK